MAEDLRTRLAAARNTRTALEQAKADRDEKTAIEELVEQEERAARDAEALDKAETTIGKLGKKIALVQTDMGAIIVKRPNAVLFKRFVDTSSLKTDDLDKLVRPCLVHPPVAEFDRILDELPATLMRVANAVTALAGVRTEEAAGK